jgi:hypothetical protein
MSLTSIISAKPFQELRDKFKTTFPRPDFNIKTEILAPPMTANHSIIGQAFDYLLRFHLEHKYKEKVNSSGSWVADSSFRHIHNSAEKSDSSVISVGYRRDIKKDKKQFLKMLETEYSSSKNNYERYLKSGHLTDELVKSCLFPARLDVTFRAGMIDANLGNEVDLDIQDVKKLLSIVNPEHFHVKDYCYINPTFGKGSGLVGGADADLIIDGTLIDLKVTKNLKLERDHLNQTIGYYILSLIGGVNKDENIRPIQNVGIYFARHGQLWKHSLSDIASDRTFLEFKEWFIDYVDQKVWGGRLSLMDKEIKENKKEVAKSAQKGKTKAKGKKVASVTVKKKKELTVVRKKSKPGKKESKVVRRKGK